MSESRLNATNRSCAHAGDVHRPSRQSRRRPATGSVGTAEIARALSESVLPVAKAEVQVAE